MSDVTQDERRAWLIAWLLAERPEYADMQVPEDEEGQRQLLRALMNVRAPLPVSDEFLAVQDAYLAERLSERGVTGLDSLAPVGDEGVDAQLYLWRGDITTLATDAIVNAANSQMLGCFVPMHACIDNCIHSFAGVQLRAECSRKMSLLRAEYGEDYEQPTAVPMLTEGYNLPARKVIHIVGPIVEGRLTEELEQDLADCYTNSLDLCTENGIRSVAFCCISTGVFRFPRKRAAKIAAKTVTEWLQAHPAGMGRVIFNVHNDEDKGYYEQELY